MDQKDNFLINEFLINSLNAAFQRNQIYKNGIDEDKKKEFRNYIKGQLVNYGKIYKSRVRDNEKHIENIINLKRNIEMKYGNILKSGMITFGTCQKFFNLFLKYLWVVGKIPIPPHCPFDRTITEKLYKTNKDIELSFTKAKEKDYRKYIETAKKLAGESRLLAEWELETFEEKRSLNL